MTAVPAVADVVLSRACALARRRRPGTQEYTIKVMPPGGPAPRLADGHPDLSGHWFPNGAGQGVSGRFGVDPAALGTFDPQGHARGERPVFQPWALAKIKAMTPTELELSKSSVNCMPRGVPAIWLQNPYTTLMVHKPGLLVQLYEVLNNWRVIHLDGRPLPKYPGALLSRQQRRPLGGRHAGGRIDRVRRAEPTSCPTAGFIATNCASPSAIRRPSMNYLIVEITVDDPKVLVKPWKSAPRRWTLGDGEVYEFYCTNNKELEELEKLRELELQKK